MKTISNIECYRKRIYYFFVSTKTTNVCWITDLNKPEIKGRSHFRHRLERTCVPKYLHECAYTYLMNFLCFEAGANMSLVEVWLERRKFGQNLHFHWSLLKYFYWRFVNQRFLSQYNSKFKQLIRMDFAAKSSIMNCIQLFFSCLERRL